MAKVERRVMRGRRLKVYGGCPDGRNRLIMACASFREFRQATGARRGYACKTGNDLEIRTAMSFPGMVFTRPVNAPPNEPWRARVRLDTVKENNVYCDGWNDREAGVNPMPPQGNDRLKTIYGAGYAQVEFPALPAPTEKVT